MIVYAETDARAALAAAQEPDVAASLRLAKRLFPGERLTPSGRGSLDWTNPPDDEVHIGCFPGVSVVAAKEFGGDYPSTLPAHFVESGRRGTIHLHAMHSVVDWFAFAVWRDGKLVRALSLSPDSGVLEDIGERLPFEVPYWAGEHPVDSDEDEELGEYPFVFHPLELGEAALGEFFGYHLEGMIDPQMLQPENVPLLVLKRSKPWWPFW
jgi:hypothetical protein